MVKSIFVAVILSFLALQVWAENPASLSDAEIAAAISSSDDFTTYKDVFLVATREVMKQRTCSLQSLKDDGSWWKSTNRGPGVYFIYCGGQTVRDRFYVNVKTGKVTQ